MAKYVRYGSIVVIVFAAFVMGWYKSYQPPVSVPPAQEVSVVQQSIPATEKLPEPPALEPVGAMQESPPPAVVQELPPEPAPPPEPARAAEPAVDPYAELREKSANEVRQQRRDPLNYLRQVHAQRVQQEQEAQLNVEQQAEEQIPEESIEELPEQEMVPEQEMEP